jgi:hypothetical protein
VGDGELRRQHPAPERSGGRMIDYFELALSLVKAQRDELLSVKGPSLPPPATDEERRRRELNDAIVTKHLESWFRK